MNSQLRSLTFWWACALASFVVVFGLAGATAAAAWDWSAMLGDQRAGLHEGVAAPRAEHPPRHPHEDPPGPPEVTPYDVVAELRAAIDRDWRTHRDEARAEQEAATREKLKQGAPGVEDEPALAERLALEARAAALVQGGRAELFVRLDRGLVSNPLDSEVADLACARDLSAHGTQTRLADPYRYDGAESATPRAQKRTETLRAIRALP